MMWKSRSTLQRNCRLDFSQMHPLLCLHCAGRREVSMERREKMENYLTVMFALPMSPLVENLMPSLVTEITTESPMPLRSLHTIAST